MRKIGLVETMKCFGADEIGTYEYNGERQRLFKLGSCVYYFDGVKDAVAIGNFPISLSLHMFTELNGFFDITFKEAEHGECDRSKVTLNDEFKDMKEILKNGYHHIFHIGDLKALMTFLGYINNFDKMVERGGNVKLLSDEDFIIGVEEAYRIVEKRINERIKFKLHVAQEVDTIDEPIRDASLANCLNRFDKAVNPYTSVDVNGAFASEYLSEIEVDIDTFGDEINHVCLKNRVAGVVGLYRQSRDTIEYRAVYPIDEMWHGIVRHIYNKTTGEHLLAISSVINPHGLGQAITLNLETGIFKSAFEERPATSCDIARFTAELEVAVSSLEKSTASFVKNAHMPIDGRIIKIEKV